MIIGNGLIAKAFQDYNYSHIVFFASGVSNSLETNKQAFDREENLLRDVLNINLDKLFVYFSTCSIYDSSKVNSPYVLHKMAMERIIISTHPNFLILRLSNTVGNGGNPALLLNYLSDSIKYDRIINIHTKATRNLIDVFDVKKITIKIIEESSFPMNNIFNIAYINSFEMIDILEIAELHFKKKVVLTLENKGINYDIDIHSIKQYFIDNKLTDGRQYLKALFEKYF